MKLNELITNQGVLKALQDKNYETPTEIQEKIIPLILTGKDVLGQSQTGTGKTLAFALPILEGIEENRKLQTLILAPTRELAIQIERDFEEVTKYISVQTTCVYGSSSIEDQIKKIKKGVEIVVGTPGRVKDLIKRNVLDVKGLSYFVLDEADEMLSMGFQEELEYIFEKMNDQKQVMLFSATMPKEMKRIAEKYMAKDYETVSVVSNVQTAENVEQEYYLVKSNTRLESLCRIVDFYNPNRSMIFCRTKRNADEVLEKLSLRGYSVDVIHGDITQGQRIATLDKFKRGQFAILIATDVAARGIHVDDVNIVINYNLPESREAYVHRIGRTGRASKSGLAITLVGEREERVIRDIESHVHSSITRKMLPTKEQIMESRVQFLIQEMGEVDASLAKASAFTEYLTSLDKETLVSILDKMLLQKLNETMGSDFDVNIKEEVKKKKSKTKTRDLGDSTRLFLTIGKMDGIDKRTLLGFLEKKANMKEGFFSGIEILPKFTFVNVNNKYLDQVLNSCNESKLNNRVIRIEVANK